MDHRKHAARSRERMKGYAMGGAVYDESARDPIRDLTRPNDENLIEHTEYSRADWRSRSPLPRRQTPDQELDAIAARQKDADDASRTGRPQFKRGGRV